MIVFLFVKHFFVTNHISHRVGEDASRHRASSQGGGGGEPRGGKITLSKHLLFYQNLVFVKELFAELDEEGDGVVYTKNLIIQLRALNEDMDKNLKVCCITYLVLSYYSVSKERSTKTWTRT